MDPDETYRRWLGSERTEARIHARHLLEWLGRGGFEPQWGPRAKADFMRWAKSHGVRTMEVAA